MTQFYVAKPDTFPRTYELASVAPARGDRFEAIDSEVIVHSKMHGSHDKPQPYALRGVAKHGRLLVQTTAEAATEYDPVGRWHEIDGEYTTEGYRFKRYALKPMASLIKLALNASKVKARDTKKQADQAARDEKCGICPVCFGDFVVKRGSDTMVHHGYERPGYGYIVGDCHGVGFQPFEISCEGTKSWLRRLRSILEVNKNALTSLDSWESITIDYKIRVDWGKSKIEKKTIKRGENGFDAAISKRRFELMRTVEKIERDVVMYTSKISNWQPAKWPRK